MHPAQPVAGHPCVRGERLFQRRRPRWRSGSSLRVPGAGLTSLLAVPGWRVIPACAGSGVDLPVGCPRVAGHPCVCRERYDVAIVGEAQDGSSPRVQGAVFQSDRRDRLNGSSLRVLGAD